MPDFDTPASLQVPTTEIYSVEELDISIPGLKEFLVLLTQNVNNMALAMNMKDTGYYFFQEISNSQFYPALEVPAGTYNTVQDPRPVYRTVVDFGALPNAALKTVAHNINVSDSTTGAGDTTYRFTRIYGCASKPTAPYQFVPIPYASTNSLAENIELDVTATLVRIRTGTNRSAFTTTFVVLEYIKESN